MNEQSTPKTPVVAKRAVRPAPTTAKVARRTPPAAPKTQPRAPVAPSTSPKVAAKTPVRVPSPRSPNPPSASIRPTDVVVADLALEQSNALALAPRVESLAVGTAWDRVELEFENLESPKMFETLAQVRAQRSPRAAGGVDLGVARGYSDRDLAAITEMGYHYLECGGYRLAAVIFEGLHAIRPTEPYYALAMGLVSDHLGDRDAASNWYRQAQRLSPHDGRADVNLAELALDVGDRARAVTLLESGARKAKAGRDEALERKALGILSLLRN